MNTWRTARRKMALSSTIRTDLFIGEDLQLRFIPSAEDVRAGFRDLKERYNTPRVDLHGLVIADSNISPEAGTLEGKLLTFNRVKFVRCWTKAIRPAAFDQTRSSFTADLCYSGSGLPVSPAFVEQHHTTPIHPRTRHSAAASASEESAVSTRIE